MNFISSFTHYGMNRIGFSRIRKYHDLNWDVLIQKNNAFLKGFLGKAAKWGFPGIIISCLYCWQQKILLGCITFYFLKLRDYHRIVFSNLPQNFNKINFH